MTDNDFPLPAAIIPLSQNIQPVEQVQASRVQEIDQDVSRYLYGVVQDGRLSEKVIVARSTPEKWSD